MKVYLNVVEMTIVWLNEMVFWELDVDFEVLLGPDRPNTVDWCVVGSTVIQTVSTDVRRSDEVLIKQIFLFYFPTHD